MSLVSRFLREMTVDKAEEQWRRGDRQAVVRWLLGQSSKEQVAIETAGLCMRLGPDETRELAFELAVHDVHPEAS